VPRSERLVGWNRELLAVREPCEADLLIRSAGDPCPEVEVRCDGRVVSRVAYTDIPVEAAVPEPVRGDSIADLSVLWRREVAQIIDMATIYVPATVAYGLATLVAWEGEGQHNLSLTLGAWVVFMIAHAALILLRGQTLGKRLLGIRVVDSETGRPCPLRHLFLRFILGKVVLVTFAPFFWMVDLAFFLKWPHRALHDRLAGTNVVRAMRTPPWA